MLAPIPLRTQTLYVGIDIGKFSHVAGFVSSSLLAQYEQYVKCPTLTFDQSRRGFEQLLTRLRTFGPLDTCIVLVERTGHYAAPLVQYLAEHGVVVYFTHVRIRASRHKSDTRDALGLANTLFNHLDRGIQVTNPLERVRALLPLPDASARLRGLIRHRYELVHETTERKNKLRAIVDETFPELLGLFKDPNCVAGLKIRETFPTRQSLIEATPEQLERVQTRGRRPSLDALLRLQEAARSSIGTNDATRLASLTFEQKQLIAELRLLQTHIIELDAEIERVMGASRECQILRSLPLGPIQAASLLAAIGNIGNFESAAALKSYLGWAPQTTQTGTSLDSETLTTSGSRATKQLVYLIAIHAVQQDTEWKALYERLVPQKCAYDARKQVYTGRRKVIGRICGSLITVIYTLLRRDYDLLAALASDETPPAPMLYDRAVHHAHRTGGSHNNHASPPSQEGDARHGV